MHIFDIMTTVSLMLNKMNSAYDTHKTIYGLPLIPDIIVNSMKVYLLENPDEDILIDNDSPITIEKCDSYLHAINDNFMMYIASCAGIKDSIVIQTVNTIDNKTRECLICIYPRDIFYMGNFNIKEAFTILLNSYTNIYNSICNDKLNKNKDIICTYDLIKATILFWCINNNISNWWVDVDKDIDGKIYFNELVEELVIKTLFISEKEQNKLMLMSNIAINMDKNDIRNYSEILNKYLTSFTNSKK